MTGLLKFIVVITRWEERPVHSAGAVEHDGQPGERTDPGPEDGHRQEGGLTVRHAALHGQQARLHLSAKGRPRPYFQCCGSGIFIPDPNFFHPGSRIRIKEFKFFNSKKWFLSSRKYDPGCSSRIQILKFYLQDPGYRCLKGSGSRFRIRNTGYFYWVRNSCRSGFYRYVKIYKQSNFSANSTGT